MKLNPTEKIKGVFRTASMSSKLLFILCCLGAVMCCITNFEGVMVLTTGLLGVLWLSSIAMHSLNKRGHNVRFNPFTALIFLCAAVFAGCQFLASMYFYNYNEDLEPINSFSRWFQEEAMDAGALPEQIERVDSHLYPFLADLDYNLIITDSQNKVVYARNAWKTGKADTIRALVCPATYYSGKGLMILMDGKGNVLAPFAVDEDYIVSDPAESGNSLTLSDSAAARDPLYEKYFPSFGEAIDKNAILLAGSSLRAYREEDESNPLTVRIGSWTTETVTDVLDTGELRDESKLIAELNALTQEQRESLKKYLSWLDSAMEGVRSSGYGLGFRARMFASPDGEYNAYLLYEYDDEKLYPHRVHWLTDQRRVNYYRSFSLCMIPAAIVFLAFWVFVDAKKRGQKSPALWAVLTLIGNVVAWIIYMIIRPQFVRTAAGQPMPKGVCPLCGAKLRNEFIACPGCGILIRNRCKNCGRALENDWSFCPYCTQAVVKELPSTQTDAQAETPSETEMPEEKESEE